MPKFRKKPVVIEALHYTGEIAEYGWGHEIADAHPWLDAAYDDGVLLNIVSEAPDGGVSGFHLRIKTLEGDMRCDPGDWLIRGIKGELYPCKPDIFAATYEAA